MKMLSRAALLLSALSLSLPAWGAIVPRGATTGDDGTYQVGVMRVPGSVITNSSGTEIDFTGITTGIGTPDCAVWTGSGDGTLCAILKGIYGLAASTSPSAVNANIGTSAPIRIVSAAASTNLTQISDSPCTVMRISGYNARASAVFIRLYNIADGSVTVGTSATYWSVEIPATTAFSIPVEQTFATACSLAMTTGSADNDTGALTAADILHLAVTYR